MRHKISKIIVAVAAVSFFSCDNESSVEPEIPTVGPCRVVELTLSDEKVKIIYDNDYKVDSVYQFEGEKLIGVVSVSYSGTHTIDIYSKDWEDVDGEEFESEFHTQLELNEAGKLVKESYIDHVSGWPPVAVAPFIHDYDTLIYDEAGKLVEVQHWNSEGNPENDYVLYSISSVVMDDNSNILSVNYKSLMSDEEINYQYTYDDKKRVSDDPALLYLLFSGADYADGAYLSRNNTLTEVSDDGQVYSQTYTYNANDRPVGVTEFGETIVMTYEGCD